VDALRNGALDHSSQTSRHPLSTVDDFLALHDAGPPQRLIPRLIGRNPIAAPHRAAYRRACGDVIVADSLDQLGTGWLIFRAVPVGRDIDDLEYVAIGPAGVFSIAVRQHPGGALWIDGGVLLVDGERMPYIREAEFEAVRASQLISEVVGSRVEVTPCLVIVEPKSLTVAKPPRRVAVLTPRDVRPWLKGLPRVLTAERVEAFRVAASQQESWQDTRNPTVDAAGVLDRFRKVHAEVNQARHVRLTWVTGALVLFWLMSVVGIGGFTTSLLFR